jgi:hypothetical protein
MQTVRWLVALLLVVAGLAGSEDAVAIEEAAYQVELAEGDMEIRVYAPHIMADVYFADFEEAQDRGFGVLFRYISGANRSQADIVMTAPVTQEPVSEKIAMTAPVAQQQTEQGWRFSFMMPAAYTMETIPQPENEAVTLRAVPERRMAAIRYSGLWTRSGFEDHKAELEAWLAARDLTVTGAAIWARYNAPWTPWFLRRNEVLIPIAP